VSLHVGIRIEVGFPIFRFKNCETIVSIDINDNIILERYAEIDAFSQGKNPSKALPKGMTARNMGKNDLWIAATGSVLNATLLTIDHHFDHLNEIFLKVIFIDQKLKREDAHAK